MFSIMNIVGARPNFMKIAPLVHVMRARPEVSAQIVHTGQHYDDKLSKVFFDELDIPRPDVNLGVGSGSREAQIAKIATVFEPVLEQMRPDLLLVVGDVNSTIACAGVARR
ncbi:MAG: UDP-N-acetylglucosamine 2-epimerase, partial [Gammaproteobacteria bacterium]|nr:UDP-N-acetylglucosamine 2-epimerase [Gammaproteobacteria bacterium]